MMCCSQTGMLSMGVAPPERELHDEKNGREQCELAHGGRDRGKRSSIVKSFASVEAPVATV